LNQSFEHKMQGVSKRRLQTKACIAGAKTFLMLFNIIFWIIGLIVLIVGLWMRISITKVFEVSREFSFALPSLFIITGTAMLVIGFFACSCTTNERPKLLYTLAGFFFVVFILVFSSSIAGYVYRDNLKESLHNSLNETMQGYGSGSVMDNDWDRVQESLKCCGVDGYSDWIYTNWAQTQNLTFPDSCCRSVKNCNNLDIEQIYKNGCYQNILDLLSSNLSSIGIGMLFISMFQLVGVALSCCLALNINKALYEEMNWHNIQFFISSWLLLHLQTIVQLFIYCSFTVEK